MTTYTVTNSNDDGPGSLRNGINSGTHAIINFAVNVSKIILTTNELSVNYNVSIGSSHHVEITRDPSAKNIFRIFNIGNDVGMTTPIQVSITNTIISGGLIESGGGINIAGNATVILNGVYVNDNFASQNAGGINANNSNVVLIDTIIENNITSIAGNSNGGGINAINSTISMIRTTINANRGQFGAGIFADNTTIYIKDSTISNNVASYYGGGINITNSVNTEALITNSTISGNIAGFRGGGMFISKAIGGIRLEPIAMLTNVTISNNLSNNAGGIYVNFIDNEVVVKIINTIVAANHVLIPDEVSDDPIYPDVVGNFSSLGNNLIGNGNGSFGFAHDLNDQIGTSEFSINPMLDLLGYYGGSTQTMALLAGSPAINAGNNAFNISVYDQRGANFARIRKRKIDIGAYEFRPIRVCYSGSTCFTTKNAITGEIKDLNVEDIIAGTHEVYNTITNCFVPIKLNVVTGLVNRFGLIKKNAFGKKQPSQDLYIGAGHKLMIDDKEIKVKNIPFTGKVKVTPQDVYLVCTNQKCSIMANGLNVMAWDHREWIIYARKRGITWTNNK